MKYTEAILSVCFFVICSSCIAGTINQSYQIDRRVNCQLYENNSNEFIFNSFINTCNGNGYSDLNQWQKKCRDLYGLEYIGWCNAEDFMAVDYSKTKAPLMYGKWISNKANGEVYCRLSVNSYWCNSVEGGQ